ncbi:hypothetical protein PTKIN_Ptkin07bG0256400 [Pterospermum kingtungense]
MRKQYDKDVELLNREREDFMKKVVVEHSDWFNKIQQERNDFLLGIETQKRELENCIQKRREKLESSLTEREEAFEREKKIELQHINAIKERAEKELEQATLGMKRLDAERMEIKLDRERKESEWAELNKSIQELKVQRLKLKQQRELLHADRKEMHAEIEELRKLGDLKATMDNMMVVQMKHSIIERGWQKASERKNLKLQSVKMLHMIQPEERYLISDHEDLCLTSAGKLVSSDGYDGQKYNGRRPLAFDREPKVIVEVPSECEVVIGIHGLESGTERNDAKKSILVTEQGIQAGRKRRVDNSPSHGTKKRRQKNDASAVDEEDISHSLKSSELNASTDQPAIMLYNLSQGGADETNVLTIDKTIKISEVTYEKKTLADDSSNLENINHLQDVVTESVEDIPRIGGMCCHASTTRENGGSQEPRMVDEEHFENVSSFTEPCQNSRSD